jgi:hypothetical protein
MMAATFVPSSSPTAAATLALPPTMDLNNISAPLEYNSKVHNRIEGYAIMGSVLGVILLVSMVLHFLLKMKRVDTSSPEWKFKHLTLAELEEENMIMELEAAMEFSSPFPGSIDDGCNKEEGEDEEEEEIGEKRKGGAVSEEQQDQEKGVVVRTQVESL